VSITAKVRISWDEKPHGLMDLPSVKVDPQRKTVDTGDVAFDGTTNNSILHEVLVKYMRHHRPLHIGQEVTILDEEGKRCTATVVQPDCGNFQAYLMAPTQLETITGKPKSFKVAREYIYDDRAPLSKFL